jgi:beta-N-acetylhexosaminidase
MIRKYLLTILLVLTALFPSQIQAQSVDSLDFKIGQMLMVGFRGLEVSDTSRIVKDIRNLHIGGVILFDYDVPSDSPVRNIESMEQLQHLNRDLQRYSSYPLLISVDQEGGKVARLKPKFGFPSLPSAAHLGKLNNLDSTAFYAHQTADMLNHLGFNMNFAPVVDLNTNPDNPVIGKLDRSFGASPDRVVKQAKTILKAYNRHHVAGALKHFPGHGSAWNDSHIGMADVSQTWRPVELEPYKRLINDGIARVIMTAHVFNEQLDDTYPATLSEATITGLLRRKLDFEGVVISDDMQMKAIRSYYGTNEAILLAIEAGVDMLLFANNSIFDPEIARKAHQTIRQAVESGRISRSRIDQSFQRIMRLKQQLQ